VTGTLIVVTPRRRARDPPPIHKEISMAGAADKISGKLKQAAGDLTGDDELEREGEVDEASGKVKDKIDSAKDTLNDAVDKVKDALD
jgi:uncharacterized protein YjbJ (UPF0337 family)